MRGQNRPWKTHRFYVVGPDGTKYFYCGNLCIKISEHFADGGKQMDELVEDASATMRAGTSSAPTFFECRLSVQEQ